VGNGEVRFESSRHWRTEEIVRRFNRRIHVCGIEWGSSFDTGGGLAGSPEIVESGLLVGVEFCRLVAVSRVLAHLAAE